MKRICIFGDSITWGMGLPSRISWADLLRNYLERKSDYYLELYNLGIDRNTTKDLLDRIEAESEARKPDTIIVLIGVNDSIFYLKDGQTVAQTPEDDFRNNLGLIVQKAKKFTQQIIFMGIVLGDERLTNPLPRSTTGKRYSTDRVKKYNEIIKEVAAEHSLIFVDINSALDDGDFIDGLHPNESGHKKIFVVIQKEFSALTDDMDKEVVLVDENENIIGTKPRRQIQRPDIYMVSSLWITNSHDQVLLAQRKWTKANDPGLWGPAVAGTVEAGETYETNIYKEADEEIGLVGEKFGLGSKKFYDGDHRYWGQRFVVKIDKDISEFKIKEDEVEQLAWFDKAQLKEELKNNPQKFVPSAQNWFDLLDA